MSDTLRPLARIRLYEQLMQRLIDHIRASDLQVGDRLPSERVLAERLGVSRNSLRQATVALEVQGVIETKHGGGTYLRLKDFPAESLTDLLDRRERLPEILEAREAIEVKLAQLAARRRNDADLNAMRQALDEMRLAVASGALGDGADQRFHAAVVCAGHSIILANFYAQIGSQLREARLESLRQPGRPERSLAQHQLIFKAIEAGEGGRAAAAARRHISTVGRVRLLSWEPHE